MFHRSRSSLFRKKNHLWMWLVLAAVILAAILAIVRLPSAMEAKSAYDRGMKAEKEKKYLTALREHKQAVERFPNHIPFNIRLGTAYYYNGQTKDASEVFDRLVEKKASRKVAAEVNGIVKKINSMYYMSEELAKIQAGYGREVLEKTRDRLLQYSSKYPEDLLCQFYLGNIYYDLEKYKEAVKYYQKVVTEQPEFFSASLNLAAAYRELGKYEESLESCQKVLVYNREYVMAYVALSKTELMLGDMGVAIDYAEKACEIDKENINAAANLCIVYHRNHLFKERDKMLEWLKNKDYNGMEALEQLIGADR